MQRWLVKTGNRKTNPPDFRWIYVNQINNTETPEGVIVLERVEWGNAYGVPKTLTVGKENPQTITGEALMPMTWSVWHVATHPRRNS